MTTKPMDDAELAKFLCIENEPKRDAFIASLTPARRAVYDRMASLETEIELWQAGLGPKPTDVLIDLERDTKRRKAWR